MAAIVIAEDDDSLRAMMAYRLRQLGHEVHANSSGRTALSWLSERPADLLVTDVSMPGVDGIELAQRAVRFWPALRVVFATGCYDAASAHATAMGNGVIVLSKPFGLHELVAAVNKCLDPE